MEPSLPVPVQELAAAAAGGKLYVIGGLATASYTRLSDVYVYDGTGWRKGPSLPLALDHPAATTLDDRIYVSGGHGDIADSARAFRLDGTSWTELAPMRHAREAHALIASGGRLCAIGGNDGEGDVAQSEVYSPTSGRWSELPGLPVPRNHVAGFSYGTNVCVAGGRYPTTPRVDCFNYANGIWFRLPDLPQETSGAGAAQLVDGSLVVMGGEDPPDGGIVSRLNRLVLGSNKWTNDEFMLVPRHGFEITMFAGRGWACGGGGGLLPVRTCTSVG